jgi:crotonobetainyl-CoA:carnitine CoA-transferase CaiB-like acyl-CoA transferase
MKMEKPGPLEGIVIADFTQLAQGPFATQIMGDLGADIVKIESPNGDWMRGFALQDHERGGESISYLAFNRNKKSIAINVKGEEGLKLALEICRTADVVIENFRPGVMKRLGLDYESIKKINPDIVYVSSTGYGSSGPYVTRPGQDLLAQAITGLPLTIGRRSDPPTPVPLGIADLTAGFHIVYGTLAALISRDRTGEGQYVEVNLMNSLLTLQVQEYTAFMSTNVMPERSEVGIGSPWAGAPFGIYKTSDGWIALAMNPLKVLGQVLGIPEFASSEKKSEIPRAEDFKLLIDAKTINWKTNELLEKLLEVDIWCAPVQDYATAITDPQILHNEMILEMEHPTAGKLKVLGIPIKFSGTPGRIRKAPPRLSEDAVELAKRFLNASDSEIEELFVKGAIIRPPKP